MYSFSDEFVKVVDEIKALETSIPVPMRYLSWNEDIPTVLLALHELAEFSNTMSLKSYLVIIKTLDRISGEYHIKHPALADKALSIMVVGNLREQVEIALNTDMDISEKTSVKIKGLKTHLNNVLGISELLESFMKYMNDLHDYGHQHYGVENDYQPPMINGETE